MTSAGNTISSSEMYSLPWLEGPQRASIYTLYQVYFGEGGATSNTDNELHKTKLYFVLHVSAGDIKKPGKGCKTNGKCIPQWSNSWNKIISKSWTSFNNTVTKLGAGRARKVSRQWQGFLSSRLDRLWGPSSFLYNEYREQSGRSVKMNIHLNRLLRLRISGAITPLRYTSSWRDA
jgi:hypothetical protein